MSTDPIKVFESHRPLLFSIAYRMLGSVMEAEDIVQETYLRYEATSPDQIRSPKAFLTTVTTRLCLDHLKSAKVQRESYVGTWLPEPLLTEETPAKIVKQNEMISMAFLVLLENLSPVERAIFLLREVFEYKYAEIARIVGKSEANCRQYYRSAKQYLIKRRPRFEAKPTTQKKLVTSFLDAVASGDVNRLTQVLAEDVTLWSDGGGKVAAAARPLHGRDIIVRLLMKSRRLQPEGFRITIAELNGAVSLLFHVGDEIIGVMNFAVDETHIHEIRAVWNPDKLQHLQQIC